MSAALRDPTDSAAIVDGVREMLADSIPDAGEVSISEPSDTV